MTAKHRTARPSPIANRLARGTAPILAAHLAFVTHVDGSLSWHLGVMDPASRKMTFPYAGVADAPTAGRQTPVNCLTAAYVELVDLALLMQD